MSNAALLAQTSWFIPLYPLIGMLLSICWSPALVRRTGPRPVGYLNLLTTLVALFHSILAFGSVYGQPTQYLELPWLQVADLNLSLPLELSALTLGATVVITLLNLLVQIYTVGYLEMDWGWGRLYALLALFEAGMTALVLCDSLFFSYILLEILTLGTYLIVGFWFNQSLVVTGARDAFLTKRVGDLILLMGVLALYPLSGTWRFSELTAWADTLGNPASQVSSLSLTLIGVALVAGPISKCAQFPLHLWLDEAMEGPLPTTILRNSVVVATGAWVLVKLEPVLQFAPVAMNLAIAIGILSALGGSLISAAQIDIKRVLSYLASTYMGLIFVAVGAGHTQTALLLILTHAAATALLLMSAGSIMFNTVTQDLTQLGGLWSRRPVTALSFATGIAGLVALPPLGGFWAMRSLAEGLWQSGSALLLGLVIAANGIVTFSLVRMFGLLFAGQRKSMTSRAPEPLWLLVLPMTILGGMTLHLPLLMVQFGLMPQTSGSSLALTALLLGSTLLGGAIAAAFYVLPDPKQPREKQPAELLPRTLNQLLAYDFYTPKVYQATAVALVDITSRVTDWLDRYVVDGLVNLVGLTSLFGGETLKYGNSGRTQVYALTITFFVAAIGLYVGWAYLPHTLLLQTLQTRLLP